MAFCKNCGKQLPDGALNDLCDSCSKTAQGKTEIITDDQAKNIAWLAYLGVLFFVPMVVYPKSRFAKFHSNQGLILFLAEIVLSLIVWVFCSIFDIVPFVGALIKALLKLAQAAVIVAYMLFGIVNSTKGLEKELPVIGHLRLIQ